MSLDRHYFTSSATFLPHTDQFRKAGNGIDQIITTTAMTIDALDGTDYSDSTHQTLPP